MFCLYHVYAIPTEPEGGYQILQDEVTSGCELPREGWELDLHLLEKSPVLLIAKSFSQCTGANSYFLAGTFKREREGSFSLLSSGLFTGAKVNFYLS